VWKDGKSLTIEPNGFNVCAGIDMGPACLGWHLGDGNMVPAAVTAIERDGKAARSFLLPPTNAVAALLRALSNPSSYRSVARLPHAPS
jgi:hypothetical protein